MRRKMWQEQAVLVFGRNPVAGVLHGNFHQLGIAVCASGNHDFTDGCRFQSFGGIVDEIYDHAAQESTVGTHQRQILSQ